jgi:flagellum-specific peptidoglycan hydrolase FlgJ
MNIISGFCATLLLICQSVLNDLDFKYDSQDEFVTGIIQCTQSFNAVVPPQHRLVIVISVAQAALESNWGKSRFAQLGNNFYGIIETDLEKPHLTALGNPDIHLKVYDKKCYSVADYLALLNTSSLFKEYRDERAKAFVTGTVDLDPLIMSLHVFAVDPFYTYKIKDTVAYLHRTYPTIFHLTTPA